jgi:hypothetical protein
MPAIHAVLLSISLLFQGLTFTAPNTWSFTGEVIEIQQIHVMGLPAKIALVQSADFEIWVILRTASQSDELPDVVLGDAEVGDLVRVSISGPHVAKNGVVWDLCQPYYSNYCRQGGLYDTGPLGADWKVPISPSNEMIHFKQHYPSTEYPLFWNTEVLKRAPALERETCHHRSCAQLCRTHPGRGGSATCRGADGLFHLACPVHAGWCAIPE